MAFFKNNNVAIRGLAMVVPKERQLITDLECFAEGEADKVSMVTGMKERRIAPDNIMCSDYSKVAALKLLEELKWDVDTLDVIIYVPTARDYTEPNTANLLQFWLNASSSCLAFDMPMACSGYVYGLSVMSSLLQSGQLKKGILIAGDTQSKMVSQLDKTLWPINGDAVTVTALEFKESACPMYFNLFSDGSRNAALIAPNSGVRNTIGEKAYEMIEVAPGIIRNSTQIAMDGMAVFQFAISEPIKAIKDLCEKISISPEQCDYLLLHQANKMIDEKLRKKLKLPIEKVPYSLDEYGNSSSGTIPVTMVSRIAEPLRKGNQKLLMCGFGAGLSWGAAYIETEKLIIPEIIEM